MKVKFCEIFEDITKHIYKIPANEYLLSGNYPIIDQGSKYISGYYNKNENLFMDIPVIVFGDHTRIFKYIDFHCFFGADGIKVLKLRKDYNNFSYKYLYYLLTNIPIIDTGYNRHFKWIKDIQLTIVKIEEQKKIANILDKVTSLISLRKEQLKKLDELIKSRFIEMFGDPVENTQHTCVLLGKITKILSGGTPSRKILSYWKNGNINWIKTTELKNNIIYNSEEKITLQGLQNSSAKVLPAKSVLIAMYGQGKTRGMTGLLAIESSTNQACACILPCKALNEIFLWKYLILSYDIIRNMAQGGNQPNLTLDIIKNIAIPLPPLELQNKFASFVEEVEKNKEKVNNSLSKLNILKEALMQKYFEENV